MSIKSITNNIVSIGVLNPNLRVFDIVMSTEYGTSYNAYFVSGSEKNALIECSHENYATQYAENIQEAVGDKKIDYIVLNHCEPDHTGSLAQIIKMFPDAQIIVSPAGALYVKNITNDTNLNIRVAKSGDSISLGDKTLEFIHAPFLHWPDSMFTWIKEEKTLFSCDFLGAHYCEPYVLDHHVKHIKKYKSAFRNYYDAIFHPFKPYVLAGLDKIKDLDIDFVCTSHGPVLTKEGLLPYAKECYANWSAPLEKSNKIIPVFYTSAYGNTQKIAQAIAQGILEVIPDASAECFDIIEHDPAKLCALINTCDGFALGSPTLNRDAVTPVWDLLSSIDPVNCAKKPAVLFGSFGWSGEAIANLSARLAGLKIAVYPEVCKVCFTPNQEDLSNAKQLGQSFAQSII